MYGSTREVVDYILTDIVVTAEGGEDDPTMRARTVKYLQGIVKAYWSQPWKVREAMSTVQFSADEGIAGLPADFLCWERDFGWLVFTNPIRTVIPNKCNPREVLSLRAQYPTRRGVVQQVIVHGGGVDRIMYRWPTLPQSGAIEMASIFYHRQAPTLVDEPADTDPITDEWSRLPVEDHGVRLEGVRTMFDKTSGDGREAQHIKEFEKQVRALYRERNLDQQPTHFGKPFRAPMSWTAPRVGDRWYR